MRDEAPCRNLAEAAPASTGCVNSDKVGLESLFPLPDFCLSDFSRSGYHSLSECFDRPATIARLH